MMETKCKSNEMIKGFVHFSIIIFIAYLFLRIFCLYVFVYCFLTFLNTLRIDSVVFTLLFPKHGLN